MGNTGSSETPRPPGHGDAADIEPGELADRVRYVGSGEHKRFPNPLCTPNPRSDASKCDEVDPELNRDVDRLIGWLREAFRRGQVDRKRDGLFPRHAWGWVRLRDGNRHLCAARLTNPEAGWYKGYFITADDLQGKWAWAKAFLSEGGAWWGLLP